MSRTAGKYKIMGMNDIENNDKRYCKLYRVFRNHDFPCVEQ